MATALAAVLLILLGVATAWAVEEKIKSDAHEYAETAAARVADDVRSGSLEPVIHPDPQAPLIQVIDQGGRVLAATPAARGLPRLVPLDVLAEGGETDFDRCLADGSCYEFQVTLVNTDGGRSFVVAAAPLPELLRGWTADLLNALVLLCILAMVAVLTWVVIGRALRPVEELRAQYEEISAGDLSRRIPEHQGEDEISRLVRTINRALDRMDQTLERQRQFASDASHELRTPIAGLRANLEDALLHPDDTDLSEVTEASLRATDRLEMIVTDLLLLARVGTDRDIKEDVDLSALVRGAAGPDVRTEIEPGLRVRAVPTHLDRLFVNLLDNARRHGGGEVALVARREGAEVQVIVTDQGPGIPEADRERVFGRFTRLDTARSRGAGGTGLGLAIAREVALAHGGTLGVEDTPKGAKFVLRLPAEPESGPESEPGEDEAQEPTADR